MLQLQESHLRDVFLRHLFFPEDFMEKTFPRWLRHSAGTSHLLGIGQQLAQHHIWGVLSSPGGSQT